MMKKKVLKVKKIRVPLPKQAPRVLESAKRYSRKSNKKEIDDGRV